jgi:hypothetical protein
VLLFFAALVVLNMWIATESAMTLPQGAGAPEPPAQYVSHMKARFIPLTWQRRLPFPAEQCRPSPLLPESLSF